MFLDGRAIDENWFIGRESLDHVNPFSEEDACMTRSAPNALRANDARCIFPDQNGTFGERKNLTITVDPLEPRHRSLPEMYSERDRVRGA